MASNWTAFTRIDRDYGACQVKPVSRSVKSFKATLTCPGGTATGEAKFSATATVFKGEVTVLAQHPSYDRTDTKILRGRWLGATCGGDANAEPKP